MDIVDDNDDGAAKGRRNRHPVPPSFCGTVAVVIDDVHDG